MRIVIALIAGLAAPPALAAPGLLREAQIGPGRVQGPPSAGVPRLAFDPPRRFTGVWFAAFEGSTFTEGAATLCDLPVDGGLVWLTVASKAVVPPGFVWKAGGRAQRVTFVGRAAQDMNRPPGRGYGHLGMFRGLVTLDRLIETEDLGRAVLPTCAR